MECAGQVEIDKFCLGVLEHHWPNVKRVEDIRDVTGLEFGTVELVCGGFPCQPFSCAGEQKGKEDDRYLWPEMLRVIKEYRPAWVIGENVAGIVNMELDNVLSDLESNGYQVQTFIIPACAVDAPHRRDRIWIIAYRSGNGLEIGRMAFEGSTGQSNWSSKIRNASNTNSTGFGERWGSESVQQEQRPVECAGKNAGSIWLPEPGLGRVANGIPCRVDRLRSLGNAVVPQIVEIIGKAIMTVEKAFQY
jgi:DNA (cytosine-5)-methyltransferase 1